MLGGRGCGQRWNSCSTSNFGCRILQGRDVSVEVEVCFDQICCFLVGGLHSAGRIPQTLDRLTGLRTFYLFSNQLSGKLVPSEPPLVQNPASASHSMSHAQINQSSGSCPESPPGFLTQMQLRLQVLPAKYPPRKSWISS